MKFTINIEKIHLAFFLVAVVVVMGVGFAVAVDTSLPYHPWDQIELPSGGATWTGLRAENADSADSVEWTNVQNHPDVGCVLYEDAHSVTCPTGMYIARYIQTGLSRSHIMNQPCPTGAYAGWTSITFGHYTTYPENCQTGYTTADYGDVLCCPGSPA